MTTTDARLREACVQFEKLLEREATYQHWTAYSGLDALKKVLKWWHEDRPWGVHAALASQPKVLVDETLTVVTANDKNYFVDKIRKAINEGDTVRVIVMEAE